jgi:hypothetical protein
MQRHVGMDEERLWEWAPELTLKGIVNCGKFSPASNKLLLQACPSTGAIHMQIPHISEQSGQAEPTKYVVDAALAAQDVANQAGRPAGFAPDAAFSSSVVSVV